MITIKRIPTATGTAELIYDATSDPVNAGWVLRYATRDGQILDECLSGEDPNGSEVVWAEQDAREFLAREGLI
jgi:hypothetical protein